MLISMCICFYEISRYPTVQAPMTYHSPHTKFSKTVVPHKRDKLTLINQKILTSLADCTYKSNGACGSIWRGRIPNGLVRGCNCV